mmetsp:Transcript_13267/g.46398  ORF Transcript_13267/g.46398 Transcript_13267/m.46398 type:complete len:206 (-) Transcript_13267:40-657(-)
MWWNSLAQPATRPNLPEMMHSWHGVPAFFSRNSISSNGSCSTGKPLICVRMSPRWIAGYRICAARFLNLATTAFLPSSPAMKVMGSLPGGKSKNVSLSSMSFASRSFCSRIICLARAMRSARRRLRRSSFATLARCSWCVMPLQMMSAPSSKSSSSSMASSASLPFSSTFIQYSSWKCIFFITFSLKLSQFMRSVTTRRFFMPIF